MRLLVEVGELGSRLNGDRRAEDGDLEEFDENEGSEMDRVGRWPPRCGLMTVGREAQVTGRW